MTHIDFNARVPKNEQKYRVHCPDGVTLGHIVDAFSHLFEKHSAAKFVMVESVRVASKEAKNEQLEQPTMKTHLPGSSAEFAMEERLLWADPKMYGVEDTDDRPTTKMYLPGSSAERAHGWQRGQY